MLNTSNRVVIAGHELALVVAHVSGARHLIDPGTGCAGFDPKATILLDVST
jgi:hypothetical protein